MWNSELGKTQPRRNLLEHEIGPTSLPATYYASSFGQSGGARSTTAWPKGQCIFVRNNPHPERVRHFKGLCDAPICMVQDSRTEGHRVLMSPPSGDQSLYHSRYLHRTGSTRYSANISKMVPAVGIVPVTYAWRDELEKLTKDIVSKASKGPERSKPALRSSRHSDDVLRRIYGDIDEHKMLDILCRILQTNSIPVVQAWMRHASESEKDIVLNMLHMAAKGELSISPSTATSGPRESSGTASATSRCVSAKPSRQVAPQSAAQEPKKFYYDPDEATGDSWASLPSPVPLDEGSFTRLASSSRPRTRHSIESSLPSRYLKRPKMGGVTDHVRAHTSQGQGALQRLTISNQANYHPSSPSKGSRRQRSLSASQATSTPKMWSTDMFQNKL